MHYFIRETRKNGKAEYVAYTNNEKEAYRLQDEFQTAKPYGNFQIITKEK